MRQTQVARPGLFRGQGGGLGFASLRSRITELGGNDDLEE
jgi:hypothetical protein